MSVLASPVAAELTKIRTVRSTAWNLSLFIVVSLGLSYLVASNVDQMWSELELLAANSYGLVISQLILVMFAVVCVGGEYSTGTIRASLAALPRRGLFYAAKLTATGLTVAAVSLVTVLAAFFTVQSQLGSRNTSLTDPEALEALVGAWIYLVLICLFSAGVAAMMRSTVRTLAVLLPVFFLGGQGLGNLPAIKPVAQFLPDQAGMVIMHLTLPGDEQFGRPYGAWTGIAILALWTGAAVIGGWLVMRRRDA